VPLNEHIITNGPRIYSHPPGSDTFTSLSVPDEQLYPTRRPSHIHFEGIKISVGPWERGIAIVPANAAPSGDAAVLLGITAPANAPTLATAGGGTIPAGNHIGYFSYVHKDNGVDIHESDLSPGSNTLTLSGTQQRTWTWDQSDAESRVTHVRFYVSVDGEVPLFVEDRAIASGSPMTEDISSYGDPPPVDADGNLTNARGVPPYARMVEKYNDRAWYGPDPVLPYRFWYSERGEPESVGPLNFFDFKDRESMTSMRKAGTDLVTQGAHVTYQVTGYDESDFQMRKVSDSIGCLSFFAAVAINEVLWFPAQLGVFTYIPGGALRNMLGDDLSTWWATEYKAYPSIFEGSVAVHDKEESLYKLLLVYSSLPRSRYLIGHYRDIDPANGGAGPMRWSFDYRGRADSGIGILYDPGTLREAVYAGTCDGYLRAENDYENDDDDGDSYGKKLTLDLPHFLPKTGKGDAVDGALLEKLDLYVQSEEKAWRMELRVGEDNAWQALNPAYARDVRASAKTIAGRSRVQQTGHHFTPFRSGKGWTITISQERARGFSYNGVGFSWSPGLGARPLR
jgi:hypothetical protein